MKKTLCPSVSDLEWLYAPGFVYHRYGEISRELGLIFPFRREWNTPEKFPLILYLPGAAWHRQELYNDVPKLTRLAERGNVLAIVQVRESELAPFPAQLEDIHRAAAWLVSHAEQFHIDTDRIFFAGHSSGGHLALISAFTKACGRFIPDGLPPYRIAGVIGLAASSDIRMCQSDPWPAQWGKRPTTCLMGAGTDEECLEMADIATCRTYVSEQTALPPVLLLHYLHDPIVNSRMSLELYEKLISTGHRADYYQLEGEEHGGNGYWAEEIIQIMEIFLSGAASL